MKTSTPPNRLVGKTVWMPVVALVCFYTEAFAAQPLFKVAVEAQSNAYQGAAQVAEAALTEAGCGVTSGEGRAITFDAALFPTKPLPVCSFRMKVVDSDGVEFYTAPKVVDDVNCSLQWLNERVRHHVKDACQKAVLLAEVEANRQANQELASRNAALELSAHPDSRDDENVSRTRWVLPSFLIAAGVGAMGWGGYLLSKDGDRADCAPQRCLYDNTARASVFLGVGGVAAAAGGWLLWHSLNSASQTSFLVGPKSVAFVRSF